MTIPFFDHVDMQNASRILNLLDAVADQEPATYAQLKAFAEALLWKDDARVRTSSNINLAAPGAALDGVTMSVGERFLATGQTDPTENGIYVFNGAAVPATRAPDADTGASLVSATIIVSEGTSQGTAWRQTAINITLGVTPINWVTFGTVAPPASETTAGIAELATQAETDAGGDDTRIVTPLKLANWSERVHVFTQLFGDGSSTQFDITHNLNNTDVSIAVYRVSDGVEIMSGRERLDANTVRLNFSGVVASNAMRCVVTGLSF